MKKFLTLLLLCLLIPWKVTIADGMSVADAGLPMPPFDSTAQYVGPDLNALPDAMRDSLLALPDIQMLHMMGMAGKGAQIVLFRSIDELEGHFPAEMIAQLKAETGGPGGFGGAGAIPKDAVWINAKGEKLTDVVRDSLMMSPDIQIVEIPGPDGKPQVVLFRSFDELSGLIPPEKIELMKSGGGHSGGVMPSHSDPFAEKWIGQPALDISGTDLAGNQISSEQHKGKVVVMNFWFTSCVPCIMEMPDLNRLVAQYDPNDVVFVAPTFDLKDRIDKLFADGTKSFDYQVIPDAMKLVERYGVKAFPTHVIIDRNGVISAAFSGGMRDIGTVLAPMIDQVL